MTESLKRASWLELFYDLAFVALVAQLTYLAGDHYDDVYDWLNIFLIGYGIFIAWWGTTANRNLQDSEDIVDKIFIQLQMVGAFLMSIAMPGVFQGEIGLFLAAFALIRGLQILMIFRLYHKEPERRPKTHNILQGIIIATLLWIAAGFVESPYGYIVAGSALVLDIMTPLTRGKGNQIRLLNVSHLQERLGLFLMLVIGESMLVVALANTAVASHLTQPVFIILGVLKMIALWWVYYFHLENRGEGIRPTNLFLYLHAHAWLFGSIILLSAGYKNLIKHGYPEFADFILITLGVIGMLITLAVIRNALHGRLRRLSRLVAVMVVVVLVVAYGAYQYDLLIEAIGFYTIVLWTLVILDTRAWRCLSLESEEERKDISRPEGEGSLID